MTTSKKKSLFIVVMMFAFLALPVKAEAGSVMIQFTARDQEVRKGEIFTVVCQVTSSDYFLDTEFQIEYDDELVRFVKGGSKVSGGNGLLTVSSTGNETAVTKRTFSLQFAAEKKGNAVFDIKGTASVTDEEGYSIASSSNRLVVTVTKKKSSGGSQKPAQDGDTPPAVTPQPKETAQPPAATKKPQGTPEPTGTPEPVKNPDQKDNPDKKQESDISFEAEKAKDRILLKNSYEFEVLDPSGLEQIPAGYVLSRIEVNGVTVPAFTMENDLANNYLLMYLKGPTGKSGIYQYDREEKTLQRYTGSMIDKINKSAETEQEKEGLPVSNYVLMGIIIGLVIIILCMLITMLKMVMKKKDREAEQLHDPQRNEGYDEERFYR